MMMFWAEEALFLLYVGYKKTHNIYIMGLWKTIHLLAWLAFKLHRKVEFRPKMLVAQAQKKERKLTSEKTSNIEKIYQIL